jgi:hypothetical protein
MAPARLAGGLSYNSGVNMEDAVIGRTYRVEWDDCCAEGSFEAVLAVKHYDPHRHLDGVTFDNGVTISGHGVMLVEVDADPA